MKQILVLGAGRSAPYLIHYLLNNAEEQDWFVTVGDLQVSAAEAAIGRHPRGTAVHFDVNDSEMRTRYIQKADVVVNLLAPSFQALVATDCLHQGIHMVSASYCSQQIRDLNADATRRGVLLLTEMGLDPGIDHMSAMSLINDFRDRGGTVTSFRSYGGGLPAPDEVDNPLKYAITWNPRNVVMAGSNGALFLEDDRVKIAPYYRLFERTWPVEVEGLGVMEGYANRDSLAYRTLFGLDKVRTILRGTLRYPGWSETWSQIVRLGLPNETLDIPNLADQTYADVIRMFLPRWRDNESLDLQVAAYLNINPTGEIMDKLRWLGLFSDEKIGCKGTTSTHMMVHLLSKKLVMPEKARDMVILIHELEVDYEDGKRERVVSTLLEYGQPGGLTAMAKAVGLPLGIAVKLLLNGAFPLTGVQIPVHPAIYKPTLEQLNAEGIRFNEKTTALPQP